MVSRTVCSRFSFVDAGGDTQFVAAEEAGRIRAASRLLSARCSRGASVGLLFKSEPALLIAWFAAVNAGLKPLIMQYPTRKQSRLYWSQSTNHVVSSVGLSMIVADCHCAEVLLRECECPVVSQEELDRLTDILADGEDGRILPDDFSIIQLSSGTTGFRKAIEFSSERLVRHVEDFNKVLNLGSSDRIVSWLPLYHDMGYVACFIMPLLLGIDVVMIDPIAWVKQPRSLFDIIERYSGTICYMPNFGFEVMSRAGGWSLPTMRHWISCSEPISESACERFLGSIDAKRESFGACYAMAENIFAVSMATGLTVREIDGKRVVSCGPAIPGVDLKLVDGEIWCRSPTSIAGYIAGPDIRDAEGYYPTGDLGDIVEGDLYVSGRKQDLLIQGGRKFILSDIDLQLNEVFPDIRGRAATLAIRDERVGTETPLLLIEAADFFSRTDGPDIAAVLRDQTGLDQVDVRHVPPRFLTKTSSGKLNRKKGLSDWLAARAFVAESNGSQRDPRVELRSSFANADWGKPIGDALDSLSRAVLEIVVERSGITVSRQDTLAEIDVRLERIVKLSSHDDAPLQAEGIRIVSLANRTTLRQLGSEHLARLEQAFGCQVSFEHVCLPPSPILLSDVIFHDYFEARLDRSAFASVDDAMERIKNASILLTDDMAEMAWLYESVYPILSHNLERDPRADLISFRWQQYTRYHDKLPLSIVAGVDIPLSASNQTIGQLGKYLDTPIFRIAVVSGFREFTQDWEFYAPGTSQSGVAPDELVDALIAWFGRQGNGPAMKRLSAGQRLATFDLPHFCSHMVNRKAVDLILERFESFCIAGEPSSLPYVKQELKRLGKSYVTVPSHAPSVIGKVDDAFECLLLCGPVGDFPSEKPTVALQHAQTPWRTRNLGEFADSLPWLGDTTASGEDWYHTFEFRRLQDYAAWTKARGSLAD